jgi:anti-sigma-K factor RskA
MRDDDPNPMKRPTDRHEDDGVVPFFGTWRAIYTAVVISALVAMVLVALFSRWPY